MGPPKTLMVYSNSNLVEKELLPLPTPSTPSSFHNSQTSLETINCVLFYHSFSSKVRE
ncbi:unnamed protein product [Sphenostylis stenocarpa]|uniref:Uncharacterized protein n=1 Tax=Sphenostylis stenocarpa TaxID=92480 RepID=A0AA86SQN8_9FABA|nr:unnamed protein product [Sphenostylis stenocarpa]